MNKLEELIRKLCPNGVEYKELEKCCNILDNKRKPVTKSARQYGEYPYYGANGIQDYVSDYIFDGTYVLVGEDGSVTTQNGNPIVTWAKGKIWVNNHAHIIEGINGVSLRYLYYYIQTINISNLIYGNIPKLNQGNFRKLNIALPPIEIQNEIVRILDNFTELEEELEEELEARKKKYEYYRDYLFDNNTNGMIELEKIADVTKLAGFEFSKYVKYSENGSIIALRGLNVKNGKILLDDVKYIDKSDFSKLKRSKLYTDDILYTYVGTVGQVGLVDKNDRYYLAPNVARIRIKNSDFIPKFVLFFLQTYSFKSKQLEKLSGSSSMKNITMTNIRKFKIPILNIAEQKRIINILDKFEQLSNDITQGLPAEIEARRKQYEYYRDKLLTFKEIKNG